MPARQGRCRVAPRDQPPRRPRCVPRLGLGDSGQLAASRSVGTEAADGTQAAECPAVLADDIGWFDIGAYHRGIMGAATPNIDRTAAEGVMLTDNYAEAGCTAGRAAFITGQIPIPDQGQLVCRAADPAHHPPTG